VIDEKSDRFGKYWQIRPLVFIKEGKKANEAGYLVGCNSPNQFSRE
jgi:hypothetical protein